MIGTEKTKKDSDSYIEAVGRRKTSVARVRLFKAGKNSLIINDKDSKEYLPTENLKNIANEAIQKSALTQKFKITVKVKGGGISSQSEAIRHGIARALIKIDPELRKKLKQAGFLKRDPRSKERRKFGLKKARKAPQWSKR